MYNENLIDFASNDYLGFAGDKKIFKKAAKRVLDFSVLAPKASLLVNGYHPIHKEFEEYLCKINGFEAALVAGSGFLANIALIEALPRGKDILFMDEEYHASGIMASKLTNAKVVFFKHNDPDDLRCKIKSESKRAKARFIIAVEGIYSMSGDLLDCEIFGIADEFKALLIVDEAHSSGVVGENLQGVFDLFGIIPKKNHIKLGTLGKAMGSYGAYILASKEVIDFLQNRAKSIIYATAPSVFDIAKAYEAFLKLEKRKDIFKKKITIRQKLLYKHLNIETKGLIVQVPMESSGKALEAKKRFLAKGFLIGAIRPPTVQKPILRIIPRIDIKKDTLRRFLEELKDYC